MRMLFVQPKFSRTALHSSKIIISNLPSLCGEPLLLSAYVFDIFLLSNDEEDCGQALLAALGAKCIVYERLTLKSLLSFTESKAE